MAGKNQKRIAKLFAKELAARRKANGDFRYAVRHGIVVGKTFKRWPTVPAIARSVRQLQFINMTSRDFCYWLQGLFELQNPKELTAEQTRMIKSHLHLVFKYEIDPSMPDPTGVLQHIHDVGVDHDPEALKGKPTIPFHGVGNEDARC